MFDQMVELLSSQPSLAARRLFYLVLPSESSYDTLESIPNIVLEAAPFFALMIAVEIIILKIKQYKSHPTVRVTPFSVSDAIGSISAGIFSQLSLLFGKSVEVLAFLWVYRNFHLVDLDPRSPWVWLFGMLGVDLGYYWVHRASHEINLFWSGHQVHHSSQRYNLSTALRQGFLQRYFSWMFYLPLGLVLPPTVFVVHLQLNLIYQFWIHTELIGQIGWLEWVLNTPSHHRVHHGREKYCVDKNYGGFLIIFDRIFGTFQPEILDDKFLEVHPTIAYGNIPPIETFEPFTIQFYHLKKIWDKCWDIKEFQLARFCKSLFYGPGWIDENSPSRLGDSETIPVVERPIQYWDKELSRFVIGYVLVNFISVTISYLYLTANVKTLSTYHNILGCFVILWSLHSIGRILNGHKIVLWEFTRLGFISSLVLMQYI